MLGSNTRLIFGIKTHYGVPCILRHFTQEMEFNHKQNSLFITLTRCPVKADYFLDSNLDVFFFFTVKNNQTITSLTLGSSLTIVCEQHPDSKSPKGSLTARHEVD